MKKIDSMNFRLSYYEDSYKFIETMKKNIKKVQKKRKNRYEKISSSHNFHSMVVVGWKLAGGRAKKMNLK